MKRRNVLVGMGGLAVGSSALVGSSAFSYVRAERDLTIAVVGDADAYLQLHGCEEHPENAEYLVDDDGVFGIDMSAGNPTEAGGEGVNPDAVTRFHNLFQIRNQGTQSVCVDLRADPIEADVVTFYRADDPTAKIDHTELDVDSDDAIGLEVGEAVCIGMEVDTRGLDASADLFDDEELTILAEAGAECESGAEHPPDESETKVLFDSDGAGVGWIAGHAEGAGSQTKDDDVLALVADDSDGRAERTWVTEEPVDLSDWEELEIEWRNAGVSTGIPDLPGGHERAEPPGHNRSHLVVSEHQGASSEAAVREVAHRGAFERTDTLDVSGLDELYVRIHARDNFTEGSARSELETHRVELRNG